MRTFIAAAALLLASSASAAPPEPSVVLNQLGFAPNASKRAILINPAAAPLDFQILDESGAVKLRGRSVPRASDAGGPPVHLLDFSALTLPGSYRLVVGDTRSEAFRIGRGLTAPLARDALAYFYHNRAGTPIEARFVGEVWARPAGHAREVAACFSGADEKGTVWPGCGYRLDVTGGWYDAGDHGKYVVNGGISVWTLLNLYERAKLAGRAPFADGALKIPEAGNGIDDLLDEARWEMEFLLRMQMPEGARASIPLGQKDWSTPPKLSTIDAGGMAHHKVADAQWTGLPTAPHEDKQPRLLYPPSTGATLNLAATAAQCARVWRGIDEAFAARCLTAARRAWAAAKRVPDAYFIGAFTGSGGYGDRDLSDEFYWAAAELAAATGEAGFLDEVRASPQFTAAVAEPGWPSTATLGTITLALVPSKLPEADRTRLRHAIGTAADGFLADGAKSGFAIPYAPERWPWGSTSSVLNRAMLLAYAADFLGDAKYRAGVTDAMDFILGRNAVGTSFVSGYGTLAMHNPHHRFWARQANPRYPGPPPGALSGGPSESFADDVARQMKGKCAGQSCWTDDYRAYSMNEVAINWNAPLAWVASWMAE